MVLPDKTFKTYKEQIELLRSRGMTIQNDSRAEKLLARVNYYRLSGYWFPFFDKTTQKFEKSITLDRIEKLYEYDASLRDSIFRNLSALEVAIRALLGYEMGRYDPFAYLEIKKLNKTASSLVPREKGGEKLLITRHEVWMRRFLQQKDRSDERFVLHHDKYYGGRLPIWAAVEIMDWGALSHLYSMSPEEVQTNMSKRCKLTAQQLESWIRILNDTRNRAAHHSRLYNKVFSRPKLPQKKEWEELSDSANRFFINVVMIAYLANALGTKEPEDLYQLLSEFPESKEIMQKIMGVPERWRKLLDQLLIT